MSFEALTGRTGSGDGVPGAAGAAPLAPGFVPESPVVPVARSGPGGLSRASQGHGAPTQVGVASWKLASTTFVDKLMGGAVPDSATKPTLHDLHGSDSESAEDHEGRTSHVPPFSCFVFLYYACTFIGLPASPSRPGCD